MWRALQNNLCARLRIGRAAQYHKTTTRLLRRLTKAIPRSQRDAPAMLCGCIAHIEHDCREPARLQQQINGA
jgi:hypothetical protein